MCHIRLYPPHRSHLHPESLSFSSTTLPSSHNTMLSYPSVSLYVMIMRWHQVQHTPNIAYTKYTIHRVQHTPSKSYSKYSIHWVQHTPSTAFTQDCLSSLHSHEYELTPECSFTFRHALQHNRLQSACSPRQIKRKVTLSHSDSCEWSTWWVSEPGAPSIDCLQLLFHTCSIMAYKFAQSGPLCAYLR
jgi:hypothetical protein